MKYTEKRHAKNLLKMLSQKEPCLHCPVDFDPSLYKADFEIVRNECCSICLNFIGYRCTYVYKCPCYIKSRQESIKHTWIALEEKGYLD